MATLANLKEDLEFSRGFEDIVEILKVAALTQFQSFQHREGPNKDFLKELEASFRLLPPEARAGHYFTRRQGLPSAVVLITSDEGFLGELDSLVVNSGLSLRNHKDDEIIVLGGRGGMYLEDIQESFLSFPGISEELKYKEVENLRDYILKEYGRKFGSVSVVYPEFLSLTAQRIKESRILPYELTAAGKNIPEASAQVLIEPSLWPVLKNLMGLWVGAGLFSIFWSAKQSEYAARIVHLEASSQELVHLSQRFSFDYFRLMHALSDKAIREISASKILLSRGLKR